MVCLSRHGHFNCLGLLEACLWTVTTVTLAMVIGFSIDRAYCKPTDLVNMDDLVIMQIRCNSSAATDKVNAAWGWFMALFFLDIVLAMLVNWGRPYNIYWVGRPVRHCDNCTCHDHIHPTDGARLNAPRERQLEGESF